MNDVNLHPGRGSSIPLPSLLSEEDLRRVRGALLSGDGRLAQRRDVAEAYKRMARQLDGACGRIADAADVAREGRDRTEAALDRIEAALHIELVPALAAAVAAQAQVPRRAPVRPILRGAVLSIALFAAGLAVGVGISGRIGGLQDSVMARISSPPGDGPAAANALE